MSEVWLFLAVGSLFLAIVLIGFAIDQTVAEKHRAVRMLESQVTTAGGQAAPRIDLREEELKENFGSRVFVPVATLPAGLRPIAAAASCSSPYSSPAGLRASVIPSV